MLVCVLTSQRHGLLAIVHLAEYDTHNGMMLSGQIMFIEESCVIADFEVGTPGTVNRHLCHEACHIFCVCAIIEDTTSRWLILPHDRHPCASKLCTSRRRPAAPPYPDCDYT